MDNTVAKYMGLLLRILLLAVGAVAFLIVSVVLLRLVMSAFDALPWSVYIFMTFILLVPAAIFAVAYFTFLHKTKLHPVGWVRMVSNILFYAAIAAWVACTIHDFYIFFTTHHTEIRKYYCFNVLFLAINIFIIFGMGILQALTTEKEKDWMDKYRNDINS